MRIARSDHRLFAILFAVLALLPLASMAARADVRRGMVYSAPKDLALSIAKVDKRIPSILPADRDVYLVMYAAATGVDACLIGRSSVDPEGLARNLDEAIVDTPLAGRTVLYTTADECSWARVSVSRSRPGIRSAEMRIPVRLVMSRLVRAGLRPHAILSVSSAAVPSIALDVKWRPSRHGTRRIYVFGSSLPAFDPILRTETREGDTGVFAIAYLLLFAAPPVLLVLGCLVVGGVRAASRSGSRPSIRKALSDPYFWAGAGFVNALTAPIMLRMPAAHRVADLWLGDGDANFWWFCAPSVAAVFLTIIARAVAYYRTWRSDPTARPLGRDLLGGKYGMFIVFGWVFLLRQHVVAPPGTLLGDYWVAFETAAVLACMLIWTRAIAIWPFVEGTAVPDPDLADRLRPLAQTFGVRLAGAAIVHCDKPTFESADVVFTGSGWLLIARRAADKLDSAGIEFIAAREFARRAQRYEAKESAAFLAGLLMFVCGTVRTLLTPTHLILADWAVWTALAGAALLAYDAYRSVRRNDEADRLAMSATRDPKAAAYAVRNLARILSNTPNDDFSASRGLSQSVLSRLRRMRASAELLGLPSTDAFGHRFADTSLLLRARALAAAAGLRGIPAFVEVGGSAMVDQMAHLRNGIVLGGRLVETFTPEEVDFVLADRIAAIARSRRSVAVAVLTLAMMAASLVWLMRSFTGVNSPIGPLLPALALMLVAGLIPFLAARSTRRLYGLPLSMTRNLPAAISATIKLHGGDPATIAEGKGIPAMAQISVQLLHRCARELGIEAADAQP